MYNLLVTAAEGAWDERAHTISVSRFLEHTDEGLKIFYGSLDPDVLASLQQLPTLFVYEAELSAPARVGRITSIQHRRDQLRITVELDVNISPIQQKDIYDWAWELEIDSSEFNRTHWSVKNVDLLNILKKSGILTLTVDPKAYRFSRSTLINACDILQTLGHTGLDRFLLELGVAGLDAGRDRGGMLARVNALTSFVVVHQDTFTADNDPLGLAIVRKAAKADPNYPERNLPGIDDANRKGFWAGLSKDGFSIRNEEIVMNVDKGHVTPIASVLPPSPPEQPTMSSTNLTTNNKKIFLVHGRDQGAKHEVARFLEKLGLKVIILHEMANNGRTLISKFQEESSDIGFAVVLMTPDDEGNLRNSNHHRLRARQNVVFELGFFIGRLGSNRVCALVSEDIEKPSDFEAVVYISFGENSSWRTELARELREARMDFDPSKVF